MLALAWPLILANLTMNLIGATDIVLMGRLGARDLASAAIGLNLDMALTVASLGIANTAASLISAELGRRTHSVREVRQTFRQTCWAVILLVIPLWILLWHTEAVMLIFGQEPDLAAGAGVFIHGYQWSLLPFLLFQVMRNFLASLERPGWVLAVSLLGIVLNGLISGTLMFGWFGAPALGIFGGGLGSSIVWTIMALLLALVLVLHPRFRRYHLFGRFWRPNWARFREVWRIGLPTAIMYGFEAGVFAGAVWLMGLFGADSVAAHAIALQIASFTFMVPMGIAQAATVRVGNGYGRKDSAAIRRSGWAAYVLGVGFMCAMALSLVLFPRPLVSIFIDADLPQNANVIGLAVSFTVIAAAFQIADGAQVVGAGMLRGLQDTRVPMIYAGFGYWIVGIGVGSLLGFGLGWQGRGIWIGLAAGLAVVAVLILMRWRKLSARNYAASSSALKS